ncbi:MAG TPA: hypothetical protein VHT96_07895 [Clostridia bacterium]|nr:hypothetical protein [Clostridia bacterium]
MGKIDDAISRIRALECPTGELENRVAGILEDYGITDRSQVKFKIDNKLGGGDAQAYRVKIAGEEETFVVLAKAGYDDYVAKVTDAYRI